MATVALYRIAVINAAIAFCLMFIAFASPYWYKSWTRVFSPFGNIGMWHICLNGYIKPRDPVMKSYVGCWWIHSTEFEDIVDKIMPVWFRFMQAFTIIVLFADLFGMAFGLLYLTDGLKAKLYKNRPRMFFINSGLMLGAAFLVFIIALVFAEMSKDDDWMPRPWMNYLSWSYGLCVLSGFLSALSGMCYFVLGLVYKDKEEHGDPGVTSAAELAAKRRQLEKQDEAMRSQPSMMAELDPPLSLQGVKYRQPHYQQQPAYQDKTDYGKAPPGKAPSVTGSQSRVGESVV
ncbi:unnamed protein product [Candidula unifasciata]|uniref:Uncharacterized protein n=1 Tax=Candidula unifasciata TaxID=100452 RepID=A0A8S3Z181_9EUPU|nr:unnamed protein product [Candidula unifasciata]